MPRPEPRPAASGWVFWGGCLLGLAALALLMRDGASTLVGGRRWFLAEDDAYISLVYAHRWARGLGWTWAGGQAVQGFSNPLWTLALGLFERAGVGPARMPLAAACLSGAALLALAHSLRRAARALGLGPVLAAWTAVLGAFASDQVWAASSGLEPVAVSAAFALGVAELLEARRDGGTLGPGFLTALVLLAWLRIDGPFYAALLLLAAWGLPGSRTAAATLALAVLALLGWQVRTFGDWLPNTARLKLGYWPGKIGDGMERYAGDLTRYTLAFGAALAALGDRRLRRLALAPPLVLAYAVATGADYYPFARFLMPALPLAVLLGVERLRRLPRRWARWAVPAALLTASPAAWAWPAMRTAEWGPAAERLRVGLELPALTGGRGRVASVMAGAFYYYSGLPGLDLLGRCDARVAAAPPDPATRVPGHNKMDLDWSFRACRPEWLLLQLPALDPTDGRPVVTAFNHKIMLDPWFRGRCMGQGRRVSEHWALYGCADGAPRAQDRKKQP